MEFNSFKKGYSATLVFELAKLYVSTGRGNSYQNNERMAVISIKEFDIYVVGGEKFRARIDEISNQDCSDKKKRKLFETEAYKIVGKKFSNAATLKNFVDGIREEALREGAESVRCEMRQVLGFGR